MDHGEHDAILGVFGTRDEAFAALVKYLQEAIGRHPSNRALLGYDYTAVRWDGTSEGERWEKHGDGEWRAGCVPVTDGARNNEGATMSDAIRVAIHHEDGSWWADSPDVAGWAAAADSREELVTLVREAADFVPFERPYVLCEGVVPSRVQSGSFS